MFILKLFALFLFHKINVLNGVTLDREQLDKWYPEYFEEVYINLSGRNITIILNQTFFGLDQLMASSLYNNWLISLDNPFQ